MGCVQKLRRAALGLAYPGTGKAAAAAMDAYDSRVVLKQLFSTATDAKAKGLGIEEEVIAQIKVRGYWQQWRCGRRTN